MVACLIMMHFLSYGQISSYWHPKCPGSTHLFLHLENFLLCWLCREEQESMKPATCTPLYWKVILLFVILYQYVSIQQLVIQILQQDKHPLPVVIQWARPLKKRNVVRGGLGGVQGQFSCFSSINEIFTVIYCWQLVVLISLILMWIILILADYVYGEVKGQVHETRAVTIVILERLNWAFNNHVGT